MEKLFTTLVLCFALIPLFAQDASFTATLNAKQVESGKVIRIDFTIKNTKGEFEAPDFTPFKIVGGPNQSSSFSMINGEVSQKYTYSYFLQAPEAGIYVIPEAFLHTEEQTLHTQAMEVVVLGDGEQPTPKMQGPSDSTDQLKEILKGKKTKKL
jgi:hypothetical protein